MDARPENNVKAFGELRQSLHKREPGLFTTRIRREANKIEIKRQWTAGGLAPLEQGKSGDSSPHIKAEDLMGREPQLLVPPQKPSPQDSREWLFMEPVHPLPQLFIAGAGHIGQALSHWGHRLDFEVTVIDDRPEFANPESLPEADHIIVGDIGEAIRNLSLSRDSYVVIVTRGHQHDSEALRACIRSEATYLGMIGSRTKIALMRDQFLEKGWATEEEWGRVFAPIGLDIHSKTVEEIAVSIAAQLVQERSRFHP
jgi:xanthine dehydrogenase accessory factor